MSDQRLSSFGDTETRADEMHRTIDQWLEDLAELTDEARVSEQFQTWLDVQSRFHDYSFQNTLLIRRQCPEAMKVAGYRTWQREFDRQVEEGESAIWIWAPIITDRCPTCHDGESYHEANDCDDDTPVEEWDRGVVGFKPVPVFDISQTEGEPLPELETAASGDGTQLLEALLTAAKPLGIDVGLVPTGDWSYGSARGVCLPSNEHPSVRIEKRSNTADVASTVVHEYAHALLHADGTSSAERAKKEVEAESVAYVVGRHFGLEMDNSAQYVARWQDEEPTAIRDRVERISSAAQRIIGNIEL